MAFKMFLKLDGIAGEATDKQYKDYITVESFSFGVSNTGAGSVGSGAGAGKAVATDVSITGPIQKSSPTLFLKCAMGSHLKSADLIVAKVSDAGLTPFLKISLADVLVSSYTDGASSSSAHLPTDSFTLNFAKIDYVYSTQSPTGALGGQTKVSWDVKKNIGTAG